MQPMSQTKHNRPQSTREDALAATSDVGMKLCAQMNGIFLAARSPGTEQGMERLTLEQ